jgi:glycerophosphoryl diester phosphodiesterase
MTFSLGIQGHRGARALFPENTLEGFRAAASLGVIRFELDVGMTADGVVVVHHDPALNPDIARDSGGIWAEPGQLIHRMTFEDLRRYDVGRLRPGSPTAALFPDQDPMDGARIPTLDAVLRALPAAQFTVEVKTFPLRPEDTALPGALTDAALSVIDAAGAHDRVVIESFDWRVPRHVRHHRPDLRRAWLTAPSTSNAQWWGVEPLASVPASVAREGGPIWAPLHTSLTEQDVRTAHALGLLVLPWTVNAQEDMRRLIAWGVDGVISDRPDLALAQLA